MGGVALLFSMASLGLPGLGNFVAEFLVLTGTFHANIVMTCIASVGLILATVYSLRIMQKIFFCKVKNEQKLFDLNLREKIVSGTLIAAIVFLGLFPQPVFNIAEPALNNSFKDERVESVTKSLPNSKVRKEESSKVTNINNYTSTLSDLSENTSRSLRLKYFDFSGSPGKNETEQKIAELHSIDVARRVSTKLKH